MRARLSVVLLVAAACLLVCEVQAKGIPVRDFFGDSAIRQPRFSPDGTRIAFLAPVEEGRYGLVVYDIASERAELVLKPTNESIVFFIWKGNERFVFGGDVGGNESFMIGSCDTNGRSIRRFSESNTHRHYVHVQIGSLFSPHPLDPDSVLMISTDSDLSKRGVVSADVGVYRVNVRTGEKGLLMTLELNLTAELADNDGNIRIGSKFAGGKAVFLHRKDNGSAWSELASFPKDDIFWAFHGFASDNRTVWITDYTDHDTGALFEYDVIERKRGRLLFHESEGEISRVIPTKDRSRLLGVAFETDRPKVRWLDASMAKIQENLDRTFPGMVNEIVDFTADLNRVIVASWSDRDPGTYYLLDTVKPALIPLRSIQSSIDPDAMRPKEPVSFSARDGLKIHGYLTRPEGKGPHPLVLLPHGGPYGIRDSWGFDPEVQFLANRGYAVLQVNYRGSGGYGRNFLNAGRGEWGGKMQDDLTDAVRWAIAEGHADPDRIGIYGASYGGYAALAGVTFTPELFRCAVNYVGVSDLRLLRRNDIIENRFTRNFYETFVGKDKAVLDARSPANHVERIRVPTLHAYGVNDPRVDIKHWEKLERELKKHRKVYEVIRERDEGHGFKKLEPRLRFYERLEAFLDRHMAPRH